MGEYVVTITPVSGGRAEADARSQMTVRVDVTDGEPHVVELTVRVPAGADLNGTELPAIDLARLAQAFGGRREDTQSAVRSVSRVPVRPANRRTSAGKAAALRAAGGAASPASGGEATGARAYRRMPEPEELQKAYAEIGSVTGVARHFGVPTHTAQGWIGRLRRQGIPVTRS